MRLSMVQAGILNSVFQNQTKLAELIPGYLKEFRYKGFSTDVHEKTPPSL